MTDKLSLNGAGGVSNRRATYEELVAEVTRLTSENASLETRVACDEADMKACANLINSQSRQIAKLTAQVERLRSAAAFEELKAKWLEKLKVVGWQFRNIDGKWYMGRDADNQKGKTIGAGYPVRNLYAIKGEGK